MLRVMQFPKTMPPDGTTLVGRMTWGPFAELRVIGITDKCLWQS